MGRWVIMAAGWLCCAAPGWAAQPFLSVPTGTQERAPVITAPPPGLSDSGPVRQDFTGKLFRYVDSAGNVVNGPVEVDGYGHGIHRDQYGRAVRAVPLDGEDGTLLLPR